VTESVNACSSDTLLRCPAGGRGCQHAASGSAPVVHCRQTAFKTPTARVRTPTASTRNTVLTGATTACCTFSQQRVSGQLELAACDHVNSSGSPAGGGDWAPPSQAAAAAFIQPRSHAATMGSLFAVSTRPEPDKELLPKGGRSKPGQHCSPGLSSQDRTQDAHSQGGLVSP
jgi:hypothetical protein